jgi:hypothetical protein
MNQPDTGAWRRPTDAELRIWTGSGAPGEQAFPLVRILNRLGHTVAIGYLIAFDQGQGQVALLSALHQPESPVWTAEADADSIWVLEG